MKNLRSDFRWIGIIIAAVLFAFSFGIENGHASPLLQTCNNTTCRGKDADQQGCGGYSTYLTVFSPGNEVKTELRRSSTCNSFWSRATKWSYSGNWMLSEALECANNNCIYTQTTPRLTRLRITTIFRGEAIGRRPHRLSQACGIAIWSQEAAQ